MKTFRLIGTLMLANVPADIVAAFDPFLGMLAFIACTMCWFAVVVNRTN